VDLVPEEFVAESVVKAFADTGGVENLKIMLARAETARDVLPESLTKMGAIVDVVPAYRTVPETEGIADQRELLEAEGADLITFTSSSTAENFDALGLRMPRKPAVASIGPITSQTLAQLGYPVDAEAEQYDIPGLIRAIRKYFAEPS
jgi:uroporphyrinogen III methyltransferase/synthase